MYVLLVWNASKYLNETQHIKIISGIRKLFFRIERYLLSIESHVFSIPFFCILMCMFLLCFGQIRAISHMFTIFVFKSYVLFYFSELATNIDNILHTRNLVYFHLLLRFFKWAVLLLRLCCVSFYYVLYSFIYKDNYLMFAVAVLHLQPL